MSPIVPPARSEPRPVRVLGAFLASLGVHALVVVVFVLGWTPQEPRPDVGPAPLLVELVPSTSPLLERPKAAPVLAPLEPGAHARVGGDGSDAAASTAAATEIASPPAPSLVATTAQAVRTTQAAPVLPGPEAPVAVSPVAVASSGPALPARPAAPVPPVVDDGMPEVAGGDPDDLVRAWLAMHQHYPRAARRHRIEGTVTLAFALDARGRVVRAEVDGTSGSRVLDRAALDLLGRAEPFPVAATDASTELPFEIEVEYRLASTRDR